MNPLRVISAGKALPAQRVSAESLDRLHGREAGYTLKNGGVRNRYFAAASDSQSKLAADAVSDALRHASLPVSSIDLLISACGVQQQALPGTACFIAQHLGLATGTPVFDVNASCLSFLMALQVAASLMAGGAYSRIAVASADLPSRGMDWNDRETSLIFGDGAAAVILEKGSATQGIRAFRMETYPEGNRYCEVRAGGSQRNPHTGMDARDFLFHMDGKAVFKLASKVLPSFLTSLMAGVDGGTASLDLVVPHQASHLGLAHAAKKVGMPASKIVNIYEEHGNQVSASMPTALHEALVSGRAKEGDRLLLIGTAAGLSVGGLVLDL